MMMHAKGLALFKGVIDAEGRVTQLELLKGFPPSDLMEAVQSGIAAARYSPATLDGRVVSVGAVWEVQVDSPSGRLEISEPRWPVT